MVSDDDPPHRERSATIPPAVGDRSTAVERTPGGNGDPDELPETIRHRLERLVPELVKKTFAAGLGAVFSTEEGIRKIARASLNVSEEIAKILTTLSFEIKTEIRFIPNSERFVGAEPDVKASVRLKRADKDKEKDEAEPKDRDSRSRLRFWRRDDDGDGNDSHDK